MASQAPRRNEMIVSEPNQSIEIISAICVIVLCLTGAVIWWPGINNWRRALTVNWRLFFARFTWDLHSALGFWGFLFVLIWPDRKDPLLF
jgi:uncharacterized iron-regulated membrane protein